MSYFPTNDRVREAMNALTRKPLDGRWAMMSDIRPPISRSDLRELMIAYYCPIVCDGVVRGAEWHKTCEAAADAGLAALEQNMLWAEVEKGA